MINWKGFGGKRSWLVVVSSIWNSAADTTDSKGCLRYYRAERYTRLHCISLLCAVHTSLPEHSSFSNTAQPSALRQCEKTSSEDASLATSSTTCFCGTAFVRVLYACVNNRFNKPEPCSRAERRHFEQVLWCSELSSGLYCHVKRLSTNVSEVHTASIITHPWWWRQYAPLKRRSTIILHGSITQKIAMNIILAAVRTWNLT
jgi:hypothetical protein